MSWLMVISLCLLAATLPASLIMLALDWETVDFKLDWTPTWPYGFPQQQSDIDPNIVTHHLFENNDELT